MTASAVSRQVKSLENELGIPLFERDGRVLSLTDSGKSLYDEVDPLISNIEQITSRYRRKTQRQTLRLSVQPFFASELFVPRLSEFMEEHPEIDMQIDTIDERSETHPATADVSIRLFRAAPADLNAEAFFPLRLVPACSPALYGKIVDSNTGDVRPFTRIVHKRRRGQWALWSEQAGVTLPEPTGTVELNSTVAVLRAAEQGLGVAMVPMPLSREFFKSGGLRPLYDFEAPAPDRYYFVMSPKAVDNAAVRLLRTWVFKTFTPLA